MPRYIVPRAGLDNECARFGVTCYCSAMADGFRSVKLTRDGQGQTVRIPAEFALPGDEATIRQEGRRLIIEPVAEKMTLLELLASWDPIDEDIGEVEDRPPEPVDF